LTEERIKDYKKKYYKKYYDDHFYKYHQEYYQKNKKKYVCEICDFSCHTNREYEIHCNRPKHINKIKIINEKMNVARRSEHANRIINNNNEIIDAFDLEKIKKEQEEERIKFYEKYKNEINEEMKKYNIGQKESQKKYFAKNKDKIKIYYEKNKNKIKETTKKYVKEHREKFTDICKKYRENNKNKYTCEKCNFHSAIKTHFEKHCQSLKHTSNN